MVVKKRPKLGSSKELRAVHPNLGLERALAKQLASLTEEMHRSVMWWVSSAYKQNEPAEPQSMLALDDSSAVALDKVMRRLTRHWVGKFKAAGKKLARQFAQRAADSTDKQLESALRDAGLSVKFKLSPAANDVLQATTKQSVSLITGLAQQHMKKVEGAVMRSVQRGGDVSGLAKELEQGFKMSRKRARFVASDQNSKATAALTKVRQTELGITQARWLHSHAGKTPRPSHEAMNNELYDVADGMWDPDADGRGKGRFVSPGELISCRCGSRSILPALN